ncbi:MAG: DUF1294 domain-containing protein [Tissierellia bacterium]|nr:DUF1294 domain-containing protein [Tissierellia bacterium]
MILLQNLHWTEQLLLGYVAIINIAAVLLFLHDKHLSTRKRGRHKPRIQETSLLLIAIAGGGFGAWIAMYAFRHKTKKPLFFIGIPIITLMNIAVFLVLVRAMAAA